MHLARVRFGRMYAMFNDRIEWADDQVAPIPYTLRCDCMHNWVGTERIHDLACALAAVDD